MKKIVKLIMLFAFVAWAQMGLAQSQKTLVKSLTATNDALVATLDGEVTVEEWDEPFIRVTTTVNLTNFDENILKRLVMVGRYSIEATNNEEAMHIGMPKLGTQVTIRGVVLEELVQYQIAVPRGMVVEVVGTQQNTTVN